MKEIDSLLLTRQSISNLSQLQQQALTSLVQNDQIVIKSANKGRNVVVMDRNQYIDQYIDMCQAILSNAEWYQLVPEDLLIELRFQYKVIITQAYHHCLIDRDLFEYLHVQRAYHTYILCPSEGP